MPIRLFLARVGVALVARQALRCEFIRQLPCARTSVSRCSSQEALAIAAIGRHFIHHCAVLHQQEMSEAFAEFSGFAMAHEDRIAKMQLS